MALIKDFIGNKIKSNDLLSKFLRVFSVDVVVRGANFLLIPVFLYLMTQKEIGIYGYLYSFAMTVSSIIGFGYYVSLQKLYADTNSKIKEQSKMLFTLTSSLIIMLFVALIVIFITKADIYFFSFLHNKDIGSDIYFKHRIYVFIAIISMILSSYLSNYFISAVKIKSIQVFNILRLILSNGICIAVLYFTASTETAMIRIAITYIIELCLVLIFGSILIKKFEYSFDFYYYKKALKIGLPIMATAIFGAFVNFGDKFYVMKYMGTDNFAVYSIAIQVSTIILIVFQSFNFIWLPAILKEKDLVVVRRKVKKNSWILFLVFSGLGVGIVFGTWFLLEIKVFPIKYFDIIKVLPFLIISQILAALTGFYTNLMIYFEKTYIQFFVNGFIALLSYFLYDYFVKSFGFYGVGVVLILLNLIGLLIYIYRSEIYFKNRIGK